ncbi:MAG: hypothetical protein Q8N89_03505 [Azonexus sp.]|nr:hypothetical protein [Azonexus sp.]
MTMAESRKRLQIKQIEATLAATSENSLYCKSVLEKMADSSGLLAQWSALCKHKAQRYNEFAYACIDIMSQSAADMNRLVSESISEIAGTFKSADSRNRGASHERRVSAAIISFPDRRIATASVLMQTHSGSRTAQKRNAA